MHLEEERWWLGRVWMVGAGLKIWRKGRCGNEMAWQADVKVKGEEQEYLGEEHHREKCCWLEDYVLMNMI